MILLKPDCTWMSVVFFQRMFRVMDSDSSGCFNSFELRRALLALGNLSNTCCIIMFEEFHFNLTYFSDRKKSDEIVLCMHVMSFHLASCEGWWNGESVLSNSLYILCKSGTVCRPISDYVGCHIASSGGYCSDIEATAQCEVSLTAPNRVILTYLLS